MFGGSQEALGSTAYPTNINSDVTFEIGDSCGEMINEMIVQ